MCSVFSGKKLLKVSINKQNFRIMENLHGFCCVIYIFHMTVDTEDKSCETDKIYLLYKAIHFV